MARIFRRSAIVMLLCTTAVGAAVPQSAAEDAMAKCKLLTDNGARLSCYDGAVTEFEAAVKNHDVVVMDRNTMREARRGLFGFTLPRTPLFNGDNVHDNVSEVDTDVISAVSLGNGKWRMRMADGALWETTEGVGWKAPKVGSVIHLKAGAFGSYFMTIDRDNPIRAMRVG